MRISPDTNILVRSIIQDDPEQTAIANVWIRRATLLAVSVPCFCELAWVLRSCYSLSAAEIAVALRAVWAADNVVTNHAAVQAGLAMLDAGGDFADGAIAYEGALLGGETFVSFDRAAVKRLAAQGRSARLAEAP